MKIAFKHNIQLAFHNVEQVHLQDSFASSDSVFTARPCHTEYFLCTVENFKIWIAAKVVFDIQNNAQSRITLFKSIFSYVKLIYEGW